MIKESADYSGSASTAVRYMGNSSNLHSTSSLSSQPMQSGIPGISQASSTLWDVPIFP